MSRQKGSIKSLRNFFAWLLVLLLIVGIIGFLFALTDNVDPPFSSGIGNIEVIMSEEYVII